MYAATIRCCIIQAIGTSLNRVHAISKEIEMTTVKSKGLNMQDQNLAHLGLDDQFVNPVLDRYYRVVIERAKGSYIYDMNGDAYLDFGCGIAVTNTGHCHPKVVEAIQKQAADFLHTSVVVHNKKYIELAQKIAEISPHGLDSVFFANSGAEAVEGAIKLARYITRRPAIINFRGSFHGRTIMAMALTSSKLPYREHYEPLPGGIYTSAYPYVYRSHFKNDPDACVKDCLEYLEMLFRQFVHPEQVAAMIVEPIQGEGGYVVPPTGFLNSLRKVADKHGILLIIDEVQTGFGRTGKMFACEHDGVRPDIMVLAKGIASGMPLSAIVSHRDLSSEWKANRHGSTYGGNPVSCAAALATIDVLQEEKLPERAAKVGEAMISRLKAFAKGKAHIGEVRGKGLMIGIEFNDKDGNPSHDICEKVAQKCFENKLIVLTCGTHSQVVRVIPPLNLTDAEVEKGCEILEKSMTL
jgi:4-aminobutyrate aminotransferase